MPIRNYSRLLLDDTDKILDAIKANENSALPSDDKTFLFAKIERMKMDIGLILSVTKEKGTN